MARITSTDDQSTDASRFDLLVAEMAARVEAGQSIDMTSLTADCPEHREQLEMLLPTLQAVVDLEERVENGGNRPIRSPVSIASGHDGELGDFRILREIGRGGMGVVYEAEQISLGRCVAVKVLPYAGILDERQLTRFKNEARAAASLNHPHIVPVHYVGSERGVHFYAMQYIEGQSLAQLIADARPGAPGGARSYDRTEASASADAELRLPPAAIPAAETIDHALTATLPDHASPARFRMIAELGIQAAEALHYAHESGVIHRDVKPSNLLLGAVAHLWVADFGLARIGADATLTMTGDLVGTLRYMSPEQLRGKTALVDHHTDVYSLGITLYELLTLRPAFEAESSEQLLRKVAEAEPIAPRSLNSAIPADLETIVLKSIAKEPSARYSTAQELADDLERFLAAKPIQARRPSLIDRGALWCRRHPWIVTSACAMSLFTAIVGFSAATISGRALREQATARRQADERLRFARRVVDDMYVSVAQGWLVDQPRMTPLQVKFLHRAAEFYRDIADSAPDDAQSQADAALALWRQGACFNQLENYGDAEACLREALARIDSALAAAPNSAEFEHRRAIVAMDLAWSLGRQNRPDEAVTLGASAADLWTKLALRFPHERQYRNELVYLSQSLGDSIAASRPLDAEPHLRRAIAAHMQTIASGQASADIPLALASARLSLAHDLLYQNRPSEADAEATQAIAVLDSLDAAQYSSRLIRHRTANAWYARALALRAIGKTSESAENAAGAVERYETLVADFADVPLYRQQLVEAQELQTELATANPPLTVLPSD